MVLRCYNMGRRRTRRKAAAMAYFLKRTRNRKGLYLQIYESFYDPERKGTAHRSVQALGYEDDLKAKGIADPVSHYRAEVDRMNRERRAERSRDRARRISSETPERRLGHFAVEALDRGLGTERDLRAMELMEGCPKVDIHALLMDLVSARCVDPCSKRRTFQEVPSLLCRREGSYTLDQLYAGVGFLGAEYRRVIEVYNDHVASAFPRDTSVSYFDCTNFYFEIDQEDSLRRKGPSKEGRHDPIVGLGLLLDAGCIPLDMTIYPGNASEKPELGKAIGEMRRRRSITGRTVRVADKGLNCTQNIADALLAGDGYIFSKSVKQLPATEQAWALAEDGWEDVPDGSGGTAYRIKSCTGDFQYTVTDARGRKKRVALPEKRVVSWNPALARKQRAEISRQVEKARGLRAAQAKRSEYGDSAKFVTFAAVDGEGEVREDTQVVATINHEAVDRAMALAGYNMIVTSEMSMPAQEIYAAYHGLWRIEESFRAMKSQLDARPVYLQKPDTIAGHFLVCYIAVLLERLLQLRVLGGRHSTEEVMGMMRGLRAVQASSRRYINISRSSPIMEEMERMTGLPLCNYYLSGSDISAIMGLTLPCADAGKAGGAHSTTSAA